MDFNTRMNDIMREWQIEHNAEDARMSGKYDDDDLDDDESFD